METFWHGQFDIDTKAGIGASYYALNDNSKPNTITGSTHTYEYYVGVRYMGKFGAVDFNAFAIYNWAKIWRSSRKAGSLGQLKYAFTRSAVRAYQHILCGIVK